MLFQGRCTGSSPVDATISRDRLEMVPAQSHKLNNVSSNLTPATNFALLAQLVEPLICNEKVVGSNPTRGSNNINWRVG